MYNQPNVAQPAKPRILVASNMWQSGKWTAETTNVLTPEERMRGWDTNWFSVIRIAWRLYQKRKKYDVVATVGHRLAIAYGIFHRLTPGRLPPHVVRELLLDEVGGTNWKWKLKRRLMQFLFSKTTYFIVNSSSEMSSYAEALGIPVRNFYFIPFHTNVQVPRYEPGALYGFAAGKSGRDFKTFAEAVSNLDYRFVVVANKENIRFIDFPPNVSVYCDIPYESYISLLRNASFVVVPLLKTPRSTGQVVILEAYALGKPVIASLAAGTIDYVDRDTGFLCETNDPSEMRIKMNYLIANPEVLRQMGHAALRRVLANHTFEHYAHNLLNVLSRVIREAACEGGQVTYTQEVGDLFRVSVITDIVPPDDHVDECPWITSDGEERCSCTPVARYYLGRRAVPQEGIEGVNLTGYCDSLDQLEEFCRKRIDQFRREAD